MIADSVWGIQSCLLDIIWNLERVIWNFKRFLTHPISPTPIEIEPEIDRLQPKHLQPKYLIFKQEYHAQLFFQLSRANVEHH